MRRYFEWVLAHRMALLALCLAVTAVAGWSASRAVVASSIGKLFLGESPAYLAHLALADDFANDEIIVVAWEDAAPLSDASLDRLDAAVAAIETQPEIAGVASLVGAQRIRGDGGTLWVESWAEAAREADDAGDAALLEELAADPLAGGLLVSADGRASALVAEMTPDPDRASETVPDIIADIKDAMVAAGFDEGELRVVGMQAQIGAVLSLTMDILLRVFPLVCVLMLGAVWLLFGRLWPAAVSTSLALLGVVWTMGLAVHLDAEVNVLFAIVPAVILIVSFSDMVHLCSAYLLELEHPEGATDAEKKRSAILAAAEDVGRACLYTSATTFVGFLSLALVPTPVFRHLGIVLGSGVAIALLQAMTLGPVLFSFLPTPEPLRAGTTGRVHRWLDGFLRGCERLVLRHTKAVLAVSGVVTAVLIWGALQLHVETDFSERLDDDHPVRVDQRWFLERFEGSNVLDLYVEAAEDGGVLNDDAWAGIVALHDRVEAVDGVDDASSMVELMEVVQGALRPDSDGRMPMTRAGLAQYLLLFEGGGGENLDQLIDFPRRRLRIALRLEGEGFRESAAVASEARAIAADVMPAGVSVTTTGMTYLLGDWLDDILRGQRNSLVVSFLVIALMMVRALRSTRMGLGSMVPNLMPLLAYVGWLGATWDQVDSDFLIVAVLALGIGVDDTIHFLVRYRLEREKGHGKEEAIRRTFSFAGRAIVMTTVILVLGFGPFASTGYLTTHMLGVFVPVCLVVAVIADLLLVPAMLVAFDPE